MIFAPRTAAMCRPLVAGLCTCLSSLLDLVYPEFCVLCGAERGERPWSGVGPRVAGLMWYDGAHLCSECGERLSPSVVVGVLPASALAVFGGRSTGPDLVSVLGQWKYHGVRGLAWPLTPLLKAAVRAAVEREGPVDCLVPLALHCRRRRIRGYNQAEVLARLVASGGDYPVHTSLLRRVRATGQQAKLDGEAARRMNVQGAFAAMDAPPEPGKRRIGLVDDLVTGGATCDAAVEVLTEAGWEVRWVATLGLAAGTEISTPQADDDR